VTIPEPSERNKIIIEKHASAIEGHKDIIKTHKNIKESVTIISGQV
jgi:hypothetical protein